MNLTNLQEEQADTGVPTEETRTSSKAVNQPALLYDDEDNHDDLHLEKIDGERWYAADDGSFFQEHRTPFFRFNLFAYAATMAAFIYLAVVITQDFIDQQKDPPTSTKINKEVQQSFPGFIICNRDPIVPLELLLAEFDVGGDWSEGGGINITDQFKTIDCGEGDTKCILLDGLFPAFLADPDNPNVCSTTNTLSVAVDINVDDYDNSTLFVGVDGFLFAPGAGEAIAESFCSEISPRCQTLAPSFEDCPKDITLLSYETFLASSGIGSIIRLTRSEIQNAPNCDQTLLQWNPVSTSMQFNPPSLSFLTESVVFISFDFTSPLVTKTTYNPISGQSMFGSLSGWWGFLTDGWGAISVLFFSERTFLFLRDRYRRP